MIVKLFPWRWHHTQTPENKTAYLALWWQPATKKPSSFSILLCRTFSVSGSAQTQGDLKALTARLIRLITQLTELWCDTCDHFNHHGFTFVQYVIRHGHVSGRTHSKEKLLAVRSCTPTLWASCSVGPSTCLEVDRNNETTGLWEERDTCRNQLYPLWHHEGTIPIAVFCQSLQFPSIQLLTLSSHVTMHPIMHRQRF